MKRTPYSHILVIISFLLNSFGLGPMAQAQEFKLPAPGIMVPLSPAFDPPMLKGIKVHPENPFKFEFILDQGNSLPPVGRALEGEFKSESSKLIKYFLASLTIPEKDLWVNLSPYEKDRVIPNSFGLTVMGRDLLAEDYMLKQITASLIYPEGETGKKFWRRIYFEAAKKFGSTNVPVNTFNKVWIVPDKAVVYENVKAGTAYVLESRLKVMLEQDYLSLQKHEGAQSQESKDGINGVTTNELGSHIVREIVIPELTREVNQNKNFAQLRQVYNSLILATWYKKKIKDSILEQVYEDKNKIAGVNINDPQEKQKIYERYLEAFKKGVYNFIKEEPDFLTDQMVPRKYFSGGMDFAMDSGPGRLRTGLIGVIKYVNRFYNSTAGRGQSIVTVDIKPVELNEFIQGIKRLKNGIKPRERAQLAKYLILGPDADNEQILERLSRRGYSPEAIRLLKGNTDADTKLYETIDKQSNNPKEQGIIQAINNSIDALGGDTGQFAKGGKQLFDWLDANGKDFISIVSKMQGKAGHMLLISKNTAGKLLIQVYPVSDERVQLFSGRQDFTHGTVIFIQKDKAIPERNGINSLRGLESVIHSKFSPVRSMVITTKVNKEEVQAVNGRKHQRFIVKPKIDKMLSGTISIDLTPHRIRIVDDGTGMDIMTLSSMPIPGGGSKRPGSMAEPGNLEKELADVSLIQDASPEKLQRGPYVSFARKGPVVTHTYLNDGINPAALMPGELILDLGRLIEITQAWDSIVFPSDHKSGQLSPMASGIQNLVQKILKLDLSPQDKLRTINTVISALDQIAGENENSVHVVKGIKAMVKELIKPLVDGLKDQGYFFLPQDIAFEKLQAPENKKPLYLNVSLFDWAGEVSLEKIGAQIIESRDFHLVDEINGQKKTMRVVVMPFKEAVLAPFRHFKPTGFDYSKAKDLPIIRQDGYVIIPDQLAGRFAALLSKGQLDGDEKSKLAQDAEMISIMASREVMTTYELRERVSSHLNMERIERSISEKSADEGLDAQGINDFLKLPPPEVRGTPIIRLPEDANMKYMIRNNKIIEIGTGKEVSGKDKFLSITPLRENYYSVTYRLDGRRDLISGLFRIENNIAKPVLFDSIPAQIFFSSPLKNFLWRFPKASNKIITFFDLRKNNKEFEIHIGSESYSLPMFSGDERFVIIQERKDVKIFDLNHPVLKGNVIQTYRRFTIPNPTAKIFVKKDSSIIYYREKGVWHLYDLANDKEIIADDIVFEHDGSLTFLDDKVWKNYNPKTGNFINGKPADSIAYDYDVNKFKKETHLDPRNHAKVFRDPYFPDFVIDERDPANYKAIDVQTYRAHPYVGEIVFARSQRGSTPLRIESINSRLLTVNYRNRLSRYEATSSYENPPDFILIKVHNYFELHEDGNENAGKDTTLIDEIDYLKYPNLNFDGKYFVFTNPETGYGVYLDPHDPENPIFADPQYTSVFDTSKVDPKAVMLWQRVLSKRQEWISTYRKYYLTLWDTFPDEIKLSSKEFYVHKINEMYDEANQIIFEEFQKSLDSNGDQLIERIDAKFNNMANHTQRIVQGWLAERNKLEDLIQEQSREEKDYFYRFLFSSMLNIAFSNQDKAGFEDFENSVIEMGFWGWTSWPLSSGNMSHILKLIKTLNVSNAPRNPSVILKMINFLCAAYDFFGRNNIVFDQLERVLNLPLEARDQLIADWYDSFKKVNLHLSDLKYFFDPKNLNNLGRARDFIEFFTNPVDMVRHAEHQYPPGTKWLYEGANELSLDQLYQFNENKQRTAASPDDLYSIEEITSHIKDIVKLPMNTDKQKEIWQLVTTQREPGAYTGEIAQDSSDAKAKNLTIDYYIDDQAKQFYEKASDDGPGAKVGRELSLLIPKSNKQDQHQRGDTEGFFGTGKYTLYAGVDRVEIVTNNGRAAYVFIVDVNRQQQRLFVRGIGKINNPAGMPLGVTKSRVSDTQRCLPGLEQMLSQRSWKAFAGMGQNENFNIHFQKENGREDLTVKGKELLSEADFIVTSPSTGAVENFGPMRVWQTQDPDLPIQIVTKTGRRVADIKAKERFLALLPKSLRPYVDELRMVIQIPLPLIQNRDSFEREEEYLPQIQKFAAVQIIKALVAKRLRDEDFHLNPIPRDWDISANPAYDKLLLPKTLQSILLSINRSRLDQIPYEGLVEAKGFFDANESALISFLVQIQANTADGSNSLLMRRISRRQDKELAERNGIDYKAALDRENEHAGDRRSRAKHMQYSQSVDPEKIIKAPENEQERSLLALGRQIAARFGIEPVNVQLVDSRAPFAGWFSQIKGTMKMYLNSNLSSSVNIIIHELGHFLEEYENRIRNGMIVDFKLSTEDARYPYTHGQRFIDMMRLAAVVALTPPEERNQAMTAKGGIDFALAFNQLQIKMDSSLRGNDRVGIQFHIDPAQLAYLQNVSGFVPVIVNIRPLFDIKKFLGVNSSPVR